MLLSQTRRVLKYIQRLCRVCGKQFTFHKSRAEVAKYCSYECRNSDYRKRLEGENNPRWAGSRISVAGIHLWLKHTCGNPPSCEMCGLSGSKRLSDGKWSIQWALIKGKKYERKRETFWGLCSRCHRRYDYNARSQAKLIRNLQKWMRVNGTWNKGKKIPYRARPSMRGRIPWNKGRKETRPEVLERQSMAHRGNRPWNKNVKPKAA